MNNKQFPLKEDELERLYDEHCDNPVMQRWIVEAIYQVREYGEEREGSFLDELREAWREDIKDSIEFLKCDIGLLVDMKETMDDGFIRQYCEYFIRIEQEELKDLYKEQLPEWLQ
ncbi:MAG: hypothetical protein JW743_02210 [Deltaproteobacteria bacterium]|nr:hypothetical protein [Deltaproteobacteria bacterium]MBN2844655.1 hypothetical protein [Deltaproteobacteria bacterium]